jgi:hypothetical protein
MRDMSGSADASATGIRSTPRMPVVRAEDYRLLEEEFADLHEEVGDGREELPWEAGQDEPQMRRRGRAHVVAALAAGIVVFVALTLHALGVHRPPSGISTERPPAPRVHAARTAASPVRASRTAGARPVESRSHQVRPQRTRRSRVSLATTSQTGVRVSSRISPPQNPGSASQPAGGEFGFER